MKSILLTLLLFFSIHSFSQYIGVRARYTETRLVNDSPNPPIRENRLILSFFEVSPAGVYTPTSLSNYDLWIYKAGFQYASLTGGVLDSTGNNYPGYAWPAPKAVSYYNTLGLNYIDCDPNLATHYVVNGHELDCGFVTVSYWDTDFGTGLLFEAFTAPNICLPYYQWPDPYFLSPGNLNFDWSTLYPGPPYNMYNFSCAGIQQTVIRGILQPDTGDGQVFLPVRFANVSCSIDDSGHVVISWSNMTESGIMQYSIESSADGYLFQAAGTVLPTQNNGGRADYNFQTTQEAEKVYYRIRAIEIGGINFFSNILPVSRTIATTVNSTSFTIYPNPLTGHEFTFRLENAPAGRYIASIITPGGQPIRYKITEHSGGNLARQVDMSGLPAGIYGLVLRSPTQKFTQQIVYVN